MSAESANEVTRTYVVDGREPITFSERARLMQIEPFNYADRHDGRLGKSR